MAEQIGGRAASPFRRLGVSDDQIFEFGWWASVAGGQPHAGVVRLDDEINVGKRFCQRPYAIHEELPVFFWVAMPVEVLENTDNRCFFGGPPGDGVRRDLCRFWAAHRVAFRFSLGRDLFVECFLVPPCVDPARSEQYRLDVLHLVAVGQAHVLETVLNGCGEDLWPYWPVS